MQTVTLPICGYRDEPVPHRFHRQDTEARHLALVLPDFGYSCDMPLLYFTVSHLLDRGPMSCKSSTTTAAALSTWDPARLACDTCAMKDDVVSPCAGRLLHPT